MDSPLLTLHVGLSMLPSPEAFKAKTYCLRAPHLWKTTRPRSQRQNEEQQHPARAAKRQDKERTENVPTMNHLFFLSVIQTVW
ncbi:E3 ubiquitin-protein ligase RNF182 isoform 2-T2 [Pluvialis apricaria]